MRPVVTVPPYINQVDRGPPTTCPAPLQVGPSGGRAGSLSDCTRAVVWVPAQQRWLCSHCLGPGLLAHRPLSASPRRHVATWSHAASSPHHLRTSGGENSLSAYTVESPWPLRTRLPSTTLSSALPLSLRRLRAYSSPTHSIHQPPALPRLLPPPSSTCSRTAPARPPGVLSPPSRRRLGGTAPPLVLVPGLVVEMVSKAVRETHAKLKKNIHRLVGNRMTPASEAKIEVLLELVKHFAIDSPTINFHLHMSGYDLGGKVFWVPIFEDQVV